MAKAVAADEPEERFDNVVENPILNNPFVEPTRFWHFERGEKPTTVDGRRPAEYVFGQVGKKSSVFESTKMKLCDGRVDTLRTAVKAWREKGYPNVTSITRQLLEYWSSPERERQLFFCQREALETIIFLTEAPRDQRDTFDQVVPGDGGDFRRYCVKMATGSGKTFVMAMLAAWNVLNKVHYRQDNRFTDAVLVVCPNLTVKERLQVLKPSDPDNYYQKYDLVPRHLFSDLSRGRFMITNWHLFQPYEDAARSVVKLGEESDEAFARRVLRDLGTNKHVLVLNDEAHHAYRVLADVKAKLEQTTLPADELEVDPTVEDEEREATVWIEGLDRIHRSYSNGSGRASGILRCIDLSATPIYGKGSGREGRPFSWIVSDFSLVDAIESGLVKIPRVPVLDNTGAEDPKYLNLWKLIKDKIPKRASGDGIPDIKILAEAEGALIQVASQWKQTFQAWTEHGRKVPPCMIVVCNNTHVAEIITTHVGKKGGALPDLKNSEDKENTIRIDTALLRKAEAALEAGQSAGDAADALRYKVSTIGKEGKPGEQVRCVVSVSMLSEGWDAANVTQILGLRAFSSQLLCEQVVGRGLRRMSYELDPETNLMRPEYVDVYGIPFTVIPVAKGSVGTIAKQSNLDTVKALAERRDLAIEFPRVTGYVFDVRHNLKIDRAMWSDLVIEPSDEPTWTEVKEMVGYSTPRKPDHHAPGATVRQDKEWFYATHRVQRTVFEIAARITNTWSAVETRALFPLIKDAVQEYVDKHVRILGDARIEEIALEKHRRVIEDRVRNSLGTADPSGGRLPVIDDDGTTEGVVFQTAKSLYYAKRSHLSAAVIDSKWERQVAIELDENPHVESWVKTDRIGFGIPYTHQGITHEYRPDFLVRVKRDKGPHVTLILEVKGRERAPEADKRQAAKIWIEAMNYLHGTDANGGYGPWAYLFVKDEQRYIVRNMLELLAKGEPWPEGITAYGP